MRLISLLLLVPLSGAAHDLTLRLELAEPAVVLFATYDDADPAPSADVFVFSPENRQEPFYEGRTDGNGAFSFVPDRSGEWSIVADDGFGHRARTEIAVDWSHEQTAAVSSAADSWREAVTGVSLIIGMTGALLWWKSRRIPAGSAAK